MLLFSLSSTLWIHRACTPGSTLKLNWGWITFLRYSYEQYLNMRQPIPGVICGVPELCQKHSEYTVFVD